MSISFSFKTTLAIAAACLSGLGAASAQQAKTALVMGAWEYTDKGFSPLVGVDKDLDKISSTLKGLGFEVTVVANPTLSQAREAVDKFGRDLTERKGVGLFFFSGHGCENEGENYLIPVGTHIVQKSDLTSEALSSQRALNRMESSGASVNVVFLDCCRTAMTKSAGVSGFAAMSAQGTFIGFATAARKVANASEEGSPYAQTLAKYMATPNLSITDMHTLVTSEVKKMTKEAGEEQTPFQYSGLDQLFYFNPKGSSASPSVPPSTAEPTAQSVPTRQQEAGRAEIARNEGIKKSIQQFYNTYWQDLPSNNPTDFSGKFVPSPTYCYASKSPTTRDFIAEDAGKFVRRYPSRTYTPIGRVRTNWTPDGSYATLTFEYEYSYSGAGRSARGKSSVTMGLARSGGDWRIAEWSEEVFKNYSEPAASVPSISAGTDRRPGNAEGFIQSWITHNESNRVGDWLSDFATRVDYCYKEDGPAGEAFLRNDRQKLIDRWPNRTYTRLSTGGYPKFTQSEDGTTAWLEIKYRYNYANNSGKSASGVSLTKLRLASVNGRWIITAFDESVSRQ